MLLSNRGDEICGLGLDSKTGSRVPSTCTYFPDCFSKCAKTISFYPCVTAVVICSNFSSLASSVPGLDKSAIIGHLDGFKSFLLQVLSDAGPANKIWVSCYRAITDGRDGAEFYSRCAEKKGTVTIVRSDDYIFGGYTDEDWAKSQGKNTP